MWLPLDFTPRAFRTDLGRVAALCAVCRDITPQRLVRVRRRWTLMYIVPLHPAGEEVQETCCERCLARRPVSETFAGVSRDPSADVLDLIQHTNAPILDHTASLAAEFARQRGAPAGDGGRLRTIRFVLFTTGWTAMWRSEHGSISPPMGVGVLLALVLIAVGPLAWWGNGPFTAWGLPAAGVGLLLIGTLFPAIVRGQRRWARTRPAYLAARGLFDLQPTGWNSMTHADSFAKMGTQGSHRPCPSSGRCGSWTGREFRRRRSFPRHPPRPDRRVRWIPRAQRVRGGGTGRRHWCDATPRREG